MQETNEKQDSIEVSRTSKGAYSWKMKLYYDGTKDDSGIIIKKLEQMDTELKYQFGGE